MKRFNYELRPSRFAMMFQLFVFCGLVFLLYNSLSPIWWLLSIIGLVVSWLLLLRAPQLIRLEYLDQQSWSLNYKNQKHVERVEICRVLDHQVYIVLHFEAKNTQSTIIWWDQVSLQQWKTLKTLAKLL